MKWDFGGMFGRGIADRLLLRVIGRGSGGTANFVAGRGGGTRRGNGGNC